MAKLQLRRTLLNQPVAPRTWWDWHLRKARGETLTEQEQQLYDAEVARQDQEHPPFKTELATLKLLRDQVLARARDNTDLRRRLSDLEVDLQNGPIVPCRLSRCK